MAADLSGFAASRMARGARAMPARTPGRWELSGRAVRRSLVEVGLGAGPDRELFVVDAAVFEQVPGIQSEVDPDVVAVGDHLDGVAVLTGMLVRVFAHWGNGFRVFRRVVSQLDPRLTHLVVRHRGLRQLLSKVDRHRSALL